MALFELHGVSVGDLLPWELSLEAGECIGLSGPSGSGKSRLLRALADLDPHQGEGRLEGEACQSLPPGMWRRRVALLPAESAWWGGSVGEHFSLAPEDAALKAMGLTELCLDWEVARCSTGERQRLALLRLLANRPRVLLLDEPTASLDPKNVTAAEAMVADYLRSSGACAIWVSHDPEQLRRMTRRQFQIEGNRVVERQA